MKVSPPVGPDLPEPTSRKSSTAGASKFPRTSETNAPQAPAAAESDAEAAAIRARFTIDRVSVGGMDPRAREQVAGLTRHHERLLTGDDDAVTKDLRDIEFITSQLADREMQVGDTVPTSQGRFTVASTFVGGGAYIALLKHDADTQPAKLVCRGTAFRGSATEGYSSGKNNVLVEMGARGVQSQWPAILEYVRANDLREMEVMGKSMGGACAQHLSILLECVAHVRVTRLVTDCSVGVGAAINDLFVQRVLSKRESPFRILAVRNGGDHAGNSADYVPAVGGVHLGVGTTSAQCEIDVCYMMTEEDSITFPRHDSMSTTAGRFLSSFSAPHCRQNTLAGEVHHVFVPRDDVDVHLSMGTWLEPWRLRIAAAISWGWETFNPTPLADYIEASTRQS